MRDYSCILNPETLWKWEVCFTQTALFPIPTDWEAGSAPHLGQMCSRTRKSCRKRVPDCLAPRLANTVSVKWVSISPLISSRSYIQAHTTDKFLFPSSRSPEFQEHTNITSHHITHLLSTQQAPTYTLLFPIPSHSMNHAMPLPSFTVQKHTGEILSTSLA
jgi:hypothetical protein